MNQRVYYHSASASPDMNYMLTPGYESENAKFPKSTSLPVHLSLNGGLSNILGSPEHMINHAMFGSNPYGVDSPSPTLFPPLNDGRRIGDFGGIFDNERNGPDQNSDQHVHIHINQNVQVQNNNNNSSRVNVSNRWTIHEFNEYKHKMTESYNGQIKEIDSKFNEYEKKFLSQIHLHRDKIKQLIGSKYNENMERMKKIRQKNFGQILITKQKATKTINKKYFVKNQNSNNNKILAEIPMKSCVSIDRLKNIYGPSNVSFNGQDYVVVIAPNNSNKKKTKPTNAIFAALHIDGEPGFSPTVSPDPVELNKFPPQTYTSTPPHCKTIPKTKINRPKRVFCQQNDNYPVSEFNVNKAHNSYRQVPNFNASIPLTKSINIQQPPKANNSSPLYTFHPHTLQPNNNTQSSFMLPPNIKGISPLQYPPQYTNIPNTIPQSWCPPNHQICHISVPIGVATQAPMQYTNVIYDASNTPSSDPSMTTDFDPNQANSVNFVSISSNMTSPDTVSSSGVPSVDAIPPPVIINSVPTPMSPKPETTPKKRGRGRPRKNNLIKPPKRGRGRPRKIQNSGNNPNMIVTPKKRGRGRPRKGTVSKNAINVNGKQKKSVMRQISDKLNTVNIHMNKAGINNNYHSGKKMQFNVIITNHTSCSPQRKNRIKNLKCKHCGKCFATNYELTRHLRIHTGERPYKCAICGKRFKQKQHMITHKKSVHDNFRPFKCEICQKQFKEKGTLTKHVQYTHKITENTLSCHFCEKSFKRKGNLKSHLKRVHTSQNN